MSLVARRWPATLGYCRDPQQRYDQLWRQVECTGSWEATPTHSAVLKAKQHALCTAAAAAKASRAPGAHLLHFRVRN